MVKQRKSVCSERSNIAPAPSGPGGLVLSVLLRKVHWLVAGVAATSSVCVPVSLPCAPRSAE
eukprot:2990687-Rhodomonas_salina.1